MLALIPTLLYFISFRLKHRKKYAEIQSYSKVEYYKFSKVLWNIGQKYKKHKILYKKLTHFKK